MQKLSAALLDLASRVKRIFRKGSAVSRKRWRPALLADSPLIRTPDLQTGQT